MSPSYRAPFVYVYGVPEPCSRAGVRCVQLAVHAAGSVTAPEAEFFLECF